MPKRDYQKGTRYKFNSAERSKVDYLLDEVGDMSQLYIVERVAWRGCKVRLFIAYGMDAEMEIAAGHLQTTRFASSTHQFF